MTIFYWMLPLCGEIRDEALNYKQPRLACWGEIYKHIILVESNLYLAQKMSVRWSLFNLNYMNFTDVRLWPLPTFQCTLKLYLNIKHCSFIHTPSRIVQYIISNANVNLDAQLLVTKIRIEYVENEGGWRAQV